MGWFRALFFLVSSVALTAPNEFPLDFRKPISLKSFSTSDGVRLAHESFGETKIEVLAQFDGEALREKAATAIPMYLRTNGQPVLHSTQRPLAQSNNGWLKYEFTMKAAGVYELVLSRKFTTLKARCLSGCGRQEISLADALRAMNDDELAVFVHQFETLLKVRLTDTATSRALIARLKDQALKRDPNLGDRFPTFPKLSELSEWRSALTMLGEGGVKPPERPSENWSELVAEFAKAPRPEPVALDPKVPHLRYGHFLSQAVPDSVVADTQAMAAVMTALARGDGYELTIDDANGKTHTVSTLAGWLSMLWETGHHIEIRDERSFANFLAYTWHDAYIRWPVWMRTGLYLNPTEEFVFPAPHSQFVWQVNGPTVNGRVAFYLGISGAAFFATFDEQRPQWTGLLTHYRVGDNNAEGKAMIRKSLDTAEAYLQRNRTEFTRFASEYPADGYGYLGICNDATAVVERSLFGKTTFYPLFRSPELLEKSPGSDDELSQILRTLPYDSVPIGSLGVGPGETTALLRRIMSMNATPFDASYQWDEKFATQLTKAKRFLDPSFGND